MTAPGLRRLLQPGPIAHERIESLEGRGEALEMSLEPRLNLIEAIARPLLAAGFEGAAVRLEGGSLRPFTYLIPAASTDARYAAYYSEPFTPAGETRLEVANVTVGRRDGQPFLHCHGLWIEADGRRRGGIRSRIKRSSPYRRRFRSGPFRMSGCAPSSTPKPISRSSILFRSTGQPLFAVGRERWRRAFAPMRMSRRASRRSAESMASRRRSCAAASEA